MKKLLLLSLVVALGVPSLALAQPTRFMFTSNVVSNSGKIAAIDTCKPGHPSASCNVDAAFGLQQFTANLAVDLGKKKSGHPVCNLTSAFSALASTAVTILKGAGGTVASPFDETFSDGVIDTDLTNGNVEGGFAVFNAVTSQTSPTKTTQTIDLTNTGTVALLCAGPQTGGNNPGTCGAATVCGSGTDCAKRGGNSINQGQGLSSNGTAYTRLFVFPLANSSETGAANCNGNADLTWAECCGDPSLYIVVNFHSTASSDHKNLYSTFEDEGDSGTSTSIAQ
jgi:hypothetical protein